MAATAGSTGVMARALLYGRGRSRMKITALIVDDEQPAGDELAFR